VSKLKINITANLFGQVLVVITQIIALPLYLHSLGVEAYGLIGFYVTLQTTIMAFDLGLGNTINREMAKYNSGATTSQRAISTVATIEALFLAIILGSGTLISIAIPFYSEDIITSHSLQSDDISTTLYMMSALIGLLWMGSLYQNGLMGLEKQVFFNLLRTISVVLNPLLTLTALYVFGPKIQTFFLAQILFSIVFIGFIRFFFFKKLNIPSSVKPVYSFDSLSGLKTYMFGTGLIGAAGVVFSVADRWILVNKVDLESFAHYTLALTMSNALYLFITPVYAAVFPRFTALISGHHFEELKSLYSLVSKALTIFVLGIAIHLSIYAEQIFQWWLRDAKIVAEVYPITQILVIGTAFNGMMILPFVMQMACGWIRIGLFITLGLLVIFVPSAFLLIDQFGAMGCAIAWTTLNFAYFVIGSQIISRKLVKVAGFPIPFLFNLGALVTIGSIAILISQFYPEKAGFFIGASFISLSFIVCMALILALHRELRNYALLVIGKISEKCWPHLKTN
jgi:O-antigen/teichoic acid export membrane protein